MKITVNTKNLIKNLKAANLIKTKVNKSELRVFENIKLIAENNTLTILKASIGNSIEIKMDAEVIEPGEIVVNEKIVDTIKALKDPEITIADNKIIKNNSEMNIYTYANDNFIHTKDKEQYINKIITVKENQLYKMFNIEYAIAKDDTRPILTGLCIKNNESCTLDGYRLSMRKQEFQNNLGYNSEIILNGASVKILNKILNNKSESTVNFYTGSRENYIKIEFNNITLYTTALEGEYVKYNNILPTEYNTKVKINTIQLLDIVKVLNSFKDENIPLIRLNINPEENIITLTRKTRDNIFIERIENIIAEGEALEIAFNAKFMLDVITNYKNNNEEYMSMEFLSKISPCLIKNNDESMKDLLLPVRLVD